MSSRKDYSNKILKILGQKKAISLPELTGSITTPSPLLNKEGRDPVLLRKEDFRW